MELGHCIVAEGFIYVMVMFQVNHLHKILICEINGVLLADVKVDAISNGKIK